MFGLFVLVFIATWAVWYLAIRGIAYLLKSRVSEHHILLLVVFVSFLAAAIGSAPFNTPLPWHALLMLAAVLPLLVVWRKCTPVLEMLVLVGSVVSFAGYVWFEKHPSQALHGAFNAAVILAALFVVVRVCAKFNAPLKWLFYVVFFMGMLQSQSRVFAMIFSALMLAIPVVNSNKFTRAYWYVLAVAASVVLCNWSFGQELSPFTYPNQAFLFLIMLAPTVVLFVVSASERQFPSSAWTALVHVLLMFAQGALIFFNHKWWFFPTACAYFLTLTVLGFAFSSRPLKEEKNR
jgi:hypothetical protein